MQMPADVVMDLLDFENFKTEYAATAEELNKPKPR